MSFSTVAVDEFKITMRLDVFDDEPDQTVTERVVDYLKCAFTSKKMGELLTRARMLDWDVMPIEEDGIKGARIEFYDNCAGYDEDDAIMRLERYYDDKLWTCEFTEVICDFIGYDYWEVEDDEPEYDRD